MTSRLECRPATAADAPAIHAIQEECYVPSMQEQIEVILERLQLAPHTCWIAADHAGPCGYLFAYPARLGSVTALGGGFAIAAHANTLYLHDLAVAPRVAGKRVGNALVELAMQTAGRLKLRYSALVSVQDSRRYWLRRGYEVGAPAVEYAEVLRTYPDGAVYMVKQLGGFE